MVKYMVSEVEVQIGHSKQGTAFRTLLAYQLEECGIGGSEDTEKFDTVNYLGADKDGKYFINFLGPGENLTEFEVAVKGFLDGFLADLKSEEYLDDYMMALKNIQEEEEMPEVKSYTIIVTRPYQDKMDREEFEYSMDDLAKLEEEMLKNESKQVDRKEIFYYLEGHWQFSHLDNNGPNNRTSYYFHNPNDGAQLLFIDIPKENGCVYTDEGCCLGREDWFDELFEFTKKMYEYNFKIN